jgi:hypothetical protein
MSAAATTVFAFGCYLLLLGVALILFPNTVLSLFGVAPTIEVWIRVAGMLVLFLGAYYLLAALAELRPFFRWSVPVRASVIVFFAVFVLLGLAPPVLLLLGAVDLAAAAWTWLALRQRDSALRSLD